MGVEIVTIVASIILSPIAWKGLTTLYDKIAKNKKLTNNEFKDYLFKKVEEQTILISRLNEIIIELKVEISALRTEIRLLETHEQRNTRDIKAINEG
jgi:uncharacterized coiled-coil protein SlyX